MYQVSSIFVENECCSKCFCFIEKQATEALYEVLSSNLPVEQKFQSPVERQREQLAGKLSRSCRINEGRRQKMS